MSNGIPKQLYITIPHRADIISPYDKNGKLKSELLKPSEFEYVYTTNDGTHQIFREKPRVGDEMFASIFDRELKEND